MASSVTIDDTEVRALVQDLGRVPGKMLPLVWAATEQAAEALEDDFDGQTAGSWFAGLKGSFTHDMKLGWNLIGAEVGPEIGRGGGSLGDIFFFGGANGGGGTGDLDGAASRVGPKYESALGDVLGDVL